MNARTGKPKATATAIGLTALLAGAAGAAAPPGSGTAVELLAGTTGKAGTVSAKTARSNNFRVEIEGLPAASTVRVEIDPLVVPLKAPARPGRPFDSGAPKPGTLRLTLDMQAWNDFEDWAKNAIYSGGPAEPRMVTVFLLDGTQKEVLRRYDFAGCQPMKLKPITGEVGDKMAMFEVTLQPQAVSFEGMAFSGADTHWTTVDLPLPAATTPVAPRGAPTRPSRTTTSGDPLPALTLAGPITAGRKELMGWLNGMMSPGGLRGQVRATSSKTGGTTLQYEGVVVERYVFPVLDASSSEDATESVILRAASVSMSKDG